MKTNIRSQRGTTLLEVLISIIVLALGLLGYAGLQSVAMRNNHDAYLRSQATVLASDVIDRIRANKAGQAGYNLAFGATPAGTDIGDWKSTVINVLPNGDAQVQILAATNKVVVTIRWYYTGSGSTQDFITESRL